MDIIMFRKTFHMFLKMIEKIKIFLKLSKRNSWGMRSFDGSRHSLPKIWTSWIIMTPFFRNTSTKMYAFVEKHPNFVYNPTNFIDFLITHLAISNSVSEFFRKISHDLKKAKMKYTLLFYFQTIAFKWSWNINRRIKKSLEVFHSEIKLERVLKH